MKLYRAIEFSKLIYLLDQSDQILWDDFRQLADSKKKDESCNWWMTPGFDEQRKTIVSLICDKAKEAFFERSLEYNALRGGRFNPSRSFGVLYTSNHAAIAALEVLFHLFDDFAPIYKNLRKNRSQIGAALNRQMPDGLDVFIPVFELEMSEGSTYHLCNEEPSLRELCEKVGFGRYLGKSFTRDFIFGNDYEISRIIGCHLHTQKESTFKVPSARLDFSCQDKLEIRNYIVPEKERVDRKLRLTGKFLEFRFRVSMDSGEDHSHSVQCDVHDSSEIQSFMFYLQTKPSLKLESSQLKVYQPDTSDPRDRQTYSRRVAVQKFFIPDPKPDQEQ